MPIYYALVAKDEEWTVCVDGRLWETWFDYVWDLKSTPDGSVIGAAVQQDMEYGMVVNDSPWENRYKNITGMLNSNGQGNYDISCWMRMSSGSATGAVTLKLVSGSGTDYINVQSSVSNAWFFWIPISI